MSRTVKIEGHRLPAGVEHLGTEIICNLRVPVVRASIAEIPELRDPDGTPLDGWFDGERGIIFLRRGLPKSVELDAKNHEQLHALIRYSGARDFLAGTYRSASKSSEHEETFIRIITPHMAAIRWVPSTKKKGTST